MKVIFCSCDRISILLLEDSFKQDNIICNSNTIKEILNQSKNNISQNQTSKRMVVSQSCKEIKRGY